MIKKIILIEACQYSRICLRTLLTQGDFDAKIMSEYSHFPSIHQLRYPSFDMAVVGIDDYNFSFRELSDFFQHFDAILPKSRRLILLSSQRTAFMLSLLTDCQFEWVSRGLPLQRLTDIFTQLNDDENKRVYFYRNKNKKLTSCERAVLTHLLDGASVSWLAEKFCCSQKTISSHKNNGLAKMGFDNLNQMFLLLRAVDLPENVSGAGKIRDANQYSDVQMGLVSKKTEEMLN